MTAQLSYLGHSTVHVALADGRVLIVDPWLKNNPLCPAAFKAPPRCDVVAVTHAHSDHCEDVPALIERHNPRIVMQYDFAQLLATRHPTARFEAMGVGGSCDVDGLRFSMTRAFHGSSSLIDGVSHAVGSPAGFVISASDLAPLYHAGDTDVFSDMQLIARLHRPKIVLLPIGDHFTMGPAGAALAASFFPDAQALIPIHHGTFPILTGTVEAFKAALPAKQRDRVVALQPGQTADWTADGLAAR